MKTLWRLLRQLEDWRKAVPMQARLTVMALALGLTVATWGWIGPMLVHHSVGGWESFVYQSCGPFCHQLSERTFQVAGHLLPLCARCTGMWLGITLGVALGVLWVPKHRWVWGSLLALLCTALSALDLFREEASQVGWPWVRCILGFFLFLGVTVAVSFDCLAVLLGVFRPRARRL